MNDYIMYNKIHIPALTINKSAVNVNSIHLTFQAE